MSWFYVAMQREPVVMWSCFIGFTGASPAEPRVRRVPPFRDVAHTEGFLLRPPIVPAGRPAWINGASTVTAVRTSCRSSARGSDDTRVLFFRTLARRPSSFN